MCLIHYKMEQVLWQKNSDLGNRGKILPIYIQEWLGNHLLFYQSTSRNITFAVCNNSITTPECLPMPSSFSLRNESNVISRVLLDQTGDLLLVAEIWSVASPERKYIKYVLLKINTIIFYNYCSVRFFTHNNVPPDLILEIPGQLLHMQRRPLHKYQPILTECLE